MFNLKHSSWVLYVDHSDNKGATVMYEVKLQDGRIAELQLIANLAEDFADQIKPDEVQDV